MYFELPVQIFSPINFEIKFNKNIESYLNIYHTHIHIGTDPKRNGSDAGDITYAETHNYLNEIYVIYFFIFIVAPCILKSH
jgi:hypothetical protein